MAILTYNPFKYQEQLFSDGLDYVIANIPGSPTLDQLADTVIDYLASLPDPMGNDTLTGARIAAINSANDFINNRIVQNLNYDVNGLSLIDSVVFGMKENSIDSLADFFSAAEEQIAEATLNTISKYALYNSLTMAKTSYTYWLGVVGTPGSWATYINSNAAINYANLPFWATSAYMGAFSGFAMAQAPSMAQASLDNSTGRFYGANISLATALVVNAGKVIFKWAERPKMLSLNKLTVRNITNGNGPGQFPSGGCTDGCGGSGMPLNTMYNCTKGGCTGDCAPGDKSSCVCPEIRPRVSNGCYM